MGWSRQFIEKVRDATDLTTVAGDFGDTKNAGPGKIKLNCPLPNHNEKTPSCYVQKEFFKCFGCGEGGDIFKFIEMVQNCDFNEAVKRLADRAGIVPETNDWVGGTGGEDKRKDLFQAVKTASGIFQDRLLDMSNKPAQKARNFLRERGVTGQMCRKYGIGYSFPKHKGLSDNLIKVLTPQMEEELKRANIKNEDIAQKVEDALKRSGLSSEYQGQATDFFFSERIMFTIYDSSDRPIAFSGRQLPGGPEPKYRNSPATEIYKKDQTLYGLNWAKRNFAKENRIIICEGQLDVIAFHESELPIAVAPCGTAITENHIKTLANYSKNIIICFDSDAAGQNATKKFVQWEQKHNLQIKVATLPKAKDPGDFLTNKKLPELKEVIDSSIPFLRWQINNAISNEDPQTIEERVLVASQCLQIVKNHHEEMFHDDYIKYIANEFDLPYTGLREKFDKLNKSQKPISSTWQQAMTEDQARVGRTATTRLETKGESKEIPSVIAMSVLSLLLHNRQTLEVGKVIPDRLEPFIFPAGPLRDIYKTLLESKSLNECIDKIEGTEDQLSIIAQLRNSKPAETTNPETAVKMAGELLVRTVEKTYETLHQSAVTNNDLESISDLGKVHTNKSIMQNEGYNLFSSEADFLIEWLRERLEDTDARKKPKSDEQ
ncbi:MAG: DNA primase [Acidimicrobiaceae bacterium]|nr:DNA primase [Acidimicrobiaceae bacterium]